MPWHARSASKFTKKADTPKRKRQWEHIADQILAKGGSEKRAIEQASGVLAREKRKRRKS